MGVLGIREQWQLQQHKDKNLIVTESFCHYYPMNILTLKCDFLYSKYPKMSYTKASDKILYANNVDPDQIEVWSGSTQFAIPLSILRNNCTENKN